ncbi:VOC family protein [Cysteiniphilum marinum]|uniref:VOC family protein n=2 Tax=Cysteiniphilum marinum TaxID=2774191 RepID=UPI00193A6777|nr:VOC family protein [Cysteiniphilum marinum]
MNFKLHHIAITVSNINDTLKFYKKIGFEVTDFYKDEKVTIYHLLYKNNITLEFFEYPKSKENEKPSQQNNLVPLDDDLKIYGIKHFALEVTSITQAYDFFLSEKISIVTKIRQGRIGVSYFFITDPDGNYIEIVQKEISIRGEVASN